MNRRVVGHSVNPYCPASWVYHQLVFLRRYRAIVLTKRRQRAEQFPFDPVYGLSDLPPLRRLLERALRTFRRGSFAFHRAALKREGAVLLHSHFATAGMTDWRLAKSLGLPHLTMFYGADIWAHSRRPGWIARFQKFTTASDLFLVEGGAMREKVVSLGAPESKVRIFHLGLDLSKIPFKARSPDADGTIRILMAGRTYEKKGHIFGLRAFARIAERHPNARLELIAGGDTGKALACRNEMRAFIDSSGLGARIRWSEMLPYDEYLRRTDAAHIFLQPSIMASDGDAEGGFPVTIIELAAAGVPVVATRHCDIPEAVLDGRSGLLADERDVDELAARLSWLIEHPEVWPSFGEAGRAHVEAEYNIERQIPRLEAMYDELLAARDASVAG